MMPTITATDWRYFWCSVALRGVTEEAFIDSDIDALIYRLGNLCLLEKNRGIKNKAYKEKSAYAKSAFKTTKTIPDDYSVWNRDSINRCQMQIGNCAKSIWKVVF